MNRLVDRKWAGLLLALACAVGILPGCGDPPNDEAEAEPHYDPVPVRVAVVQATTIKPTLPLVGMVIAKPEQTAVIGAQTAGTIDKVLVVEGQSIQPNVPLILLDARVANADKARAQAVVDQQKAVLSRLQRGPLPLEVDAAQQAVAKAKADVDALAAKLEALKPLRQQGEVSQVQFDVAQAALNAAQADHAAAVAKLALLKAGARPEDIAEAKAKLANAQADLDAAELAVNFCRITSPIKGVVTQLTGRRGMSVDRNASLAVVVDESTMFVRFRVPNASLYKVRPGATVHVQLTARPEQSLAGNVTRLASQADDATGDVDAFATIANDADILRPGLGCRVTVDLPQIRDALVIPAIALADRDGTPVVTIVKDNKAHEVEIKVGARYRDQVQVLQGLSSGDVIVTANGYGLPDDCPVTIIKD